MKIIFLDQNKYLGGGQVILTTGLKAALAHFDDVYLLAPMGGELEIYLRNRLAHLKLLDSSEIKLNYGKKNIIDIIVMIHFTFRMLFKYKDFFRKVDFIYANGPRMYLLGFLSSIIFRKKCIYHIHLDHSNVALSLLNLIAILKYTQQIIVPSNYIFEKVFRAFKFQGQKKLLLLENGLDLRYLNINFYQKPSAAFGRTRFAVIGAIRDEKGQDRAINLAKKSKNVELHVIGSVGVGAEKWANELRNYSDKNIIYHGECSCPNEILKREQIQIVLVPSRVKESFGLVAIESMACSCAVIVWCSGGLVEIAERTGAILCTNEQELQQIFNWLTSLNDFEFRNLCKSQYDNTIVKYGHIEFMNRYNKFFNRVLNAIDK
jgi:glycosyltransferase involved in cell wall biosynthesis